MKQHKQPCAECPFRRVAPAGWLGGNTVAKFVAIAMADVPMPCHMHLSSITGDGKGVTYAKPGDAPQCAGRSIFWANQCKTARISGTILELKPDHGAVFSWRDQFIEHHSKEKRRGP